MAIVNPGGGEVPVIEDGLYLATVTASTPITLDEPDKYGNDLKLEIQIAFADMDGNKFTLEPRVNLKWGEMSTLYAIAVACGCEANPNVPFDTDDLLGKKVQVLVETAEAGKWPRVKTWVKASSKKADPPGLAQAWANAKVPASSPPSVLKADGTVDWSAFWPATKRLGMTRESVVAAWGGNVDNLTNADGVDVAAWLQECAEKLVS